jgi:hypothetical protein
MVMPSVVTLSLLLRRPGKEKSERRRSGNASTLITIMLVIRVLATRPRQANSSKSLPKSKKSFENGKKSVHDRLMSDYRDTNQGVTGELS